MNNSSEHSEQVGLLNWFKLKYPNILIMAIPNGGKRDIKTATKLKREGTVRGVPDLFVPEWKLWIEMKKSSGGRLSQYQKNIITHLESIGYTCIVGNGATDASKKILDFLNSKR